MIRQRAIQWAQWGIALSMAVTAYVYFWNDESLDPKISHVISSEHAALADEENAYVYVLGMHAAPEQSPMEVGQWLIDGVRTQKNAYRGLWNVSQMDLPELRNSLAVHNEELRCGSKDITCISEFLNDTNRVDAFAKKNSIALNRFKELLGFKHYRALTAPSKIVQFRGHSVIIAANRALMVEFAQQVKHNPEESMTTLLGIRKQIIHHIEMADNLLYKSLMVKVLEQQLHWIDTLKRVNILNEKNYQHIATHLSALNAETLSFASYVKSELKYMADYYLSPAAQDAAYDRHIAAMNPPNSSAIPVWLTQIIFKPHYTLNAIAEKLNEVTRLSEMTANEFEAYLALKSEKGTSLKSFRSLATKSDIEVYSPNFESRIRAFHAYNKQVAQIKSDLPVATQVVSFSQ